MFTIRRLLLDSLLHRYSPLMGPLVLDIGGKRLNPRGSFSPIHQKHCNWKYLNVDNSTSPDFSTPIDSLDFSAQDMPERFNTFIFTEVVEYLDNPTQAFVNIRKVAANNALILFSAPWMNTFHGDREFDYARYSESYFNKLLDAQNITVLENNRMGGLFCVVWDFLHRIYYNNDRPRRCLIVLKVFLVLSRQIFICLDKTFPTSSVVTTGYFLVLRIS